MTTSLHFVLIEDDPCDAERIKLELARNGLAIQWRRASSKEGLRKALDADCPDLILAGRSPQGFDGLTALQIVLEHHRDVPFIFISSPPEEELATRILDCGAAGHLPKDRLQRLSSIVKHALANARERQGRRLAEAALEQQRAVLRTLIDSLPQGIYAVDADNRLVMANDALLRLTDGNADKADEVSGRRLSEIWKDEAARKIEAAAARSMRTGRGLVAQEHRLTRPDGTVAWFTLTQVPLRDRTTVSGLLCTMQDLTTRKVLEQDILEISDREQHRLGSDLHDGLGQELTGIALLIECLKTRILLQSPQHLAAVTQIGELLAQAMRNTRSIARGLAPLELEHGGLPEALRLLVQHCSEFHHLSCRFANHAPRLPELQESAATHLYRIAQEAMTNAMRHAHAQTILIELRCTARQLQLTITDDGIGLGDGLAQGAPGMGLKIMEYRARMLGGTLRFQRPKVGTRITLSAPLRLLRRTGQRTPRKS